MKHKQKPYHTYLIQLGDEDVLHICYRSADTMKEALAIARATPTWNITRLSWDPRLSAIIIAQSKGDDLMGQKGFLNNIRNWRKNLRFPLDNINNYNAD